MLSNVVRMVTNLFIGGYMSKSNEIGAYCKEFRTQILRLTLRELCEVSGTNIKTLSAFENGRSTNLAHVITYIEAGTKEQKAIFSNRVTKILRG